VSAPSAREADRTSAQADEALHLALRAAHWNVSEVAREMGLARMTLYRRMKRAGIVPPNRAV
jgi:transcriptional regulator of acetoin/glycerol metabolism